MQTSGDLRSSWITKELVLYLIKCERHARKASPNPPSQLQPSFHRVPQQTRAEKWRQPPSMNLTLSQPLPSHCYYCAGMQNYMNTLFPQFLLPLPDTYHMALLVQYPPPPLQSCPTLFPLHWARNAPLAGGSNPRTTDRIPEATTRGPAISILAKWGVGTWNVRRLVNNGYCTLRERLIQATNLDIICLCKI